MADEELWPTPRYAEEIVFEGCARLAIAPEEYEALYNAHEALRAQLEQAQETIKDLDYVEASWRNGFAKLMREHDEAKATITRQRAWIEKAGHRPGCNHWLCRECNAGGQTGLQRIRHHSHMYHEFQSGICDCGYSELVGG